MKLITFDFYRVTADDSGPIDLTTQLDALVARDLKDRTRKEGGDAVRLGRLEKDGQQRFGEFIRIRLDEPAMLAGVSAEARPATVDDNEGVALSNVFLYDPTRQTFAYQRCRGGVSARSMWAHLMESFPGLQFIALPILRQEIMQQLLAMEGPRRIEFAAAVPRLQPRDVAHATLRSVVEAAQTMGSTTAALTLAVGRKRSLSLLKKEVIDFIRDVLRLKNDGTHVKKLCVTANFGGDDGTEPLDLLDASLKSVQKVDPSRAINEFYRRRIHALREAWNAVARFL